MTASTLRPAISVRQRLELDSQLEKARDYYHKANETDRQKLRQEILSGEDEILQLNSSIHQLKKKIREAEIKVIN